MTKAIAAMMVSLTKKIIKILLYGHRLTIPCLCGVLCCATVMTISVNNTSFTKIKI